MKEHPIHETNRLCKKIMEELKRKENILNEQEIVVFEANILVSPPPSEQKSSGGIIMPEIKEDEPNELVSGDVRQVGPGFMVPNSTDNSSDIDAIIKSVESNEKASVKHIPMNIEVGDRVYYYKQAGDKIELLGEKYIIVPYGSIKVLLRQKV